MTTALRAEHKERYAPLRIEEKSISALLEHYKVGGFWLFGQKKPTQWHASSVSKDQ